MQNTNYKPTIIPGYNGRYTIEIQGKNAIIFDTVKNREVKQGLDRGHLRVTLNNGDTRITEYTHYLVAKTFVPNPLNWKCVIFKDRDYTNVNPSNIIWVENRDGVHTGTDVIMSYQRNRRRIREEWKQIKDFEGYYISNLGQIARDGKVIIPRLSGCEKTYKVNLSKNGEHYTKSIHLLMAEAFNLPNPNNYKFLMFKDGNKANLCIDNLYYSKHNASALNPYIEPIYTISAYQELRDTLNNIGLNEINKNINDDELEEVLNELLANQQTKDLIKNIIEKKVGVINS